MLQPETRFATVGGDRVAYQVLGEGPRDLLYTFGYWGHLDIFWEDPQIARFLRHLASFSRLILFDRRGTGLSDKLPDDGRSGMEHWLEDCFAVLQAARSAAPVIFGAATFDIGPLMLTFVERHPDRCSGLILANATACSLAKPGYSEGLTPEFWQQLRESFLETWGQPQFSAWYLPSQANNESVLRWFGKFMRSMASPRTVVANLEEGAGFDVRHVLPRIRVPTLVMARKSFQMVPLAQGRYLAEHIPGARFVELPGSDGGLHWERPELTLGYIKEFVTGVRDGAEVERVLTTVLFSDIVDSTQFAAKVGDAAWRALLDRHDQCTREQVTLFGGKLIERTGDGLLATFDRPARAIDCALSLHEALEPLGIRVRAGAHTGEVELREDGRVGGLAVHLGARVAAMANAGEVLVSHTVRGVLLGSHYRFEDRGVHELKGVPEKWLLFGVSVPSC